jgi:hypothetical protein
MLLATSGMQRQYVVQEHRIVCSILHHPAVPEFMPFGIPGGGNLSKQLFHLHDCQLPSMQ